VASVKIGHAALNSAARTRSVEVFRNETLV
jgi:hypothetical protein